MRNPVQRSSVFGGILKEVKNSKQEEVRRNRCSSCVLEECPPGFKDDLPPGFSHRPSSTPELQASVNNSSSPRTTQNLPAGCISPPLRPSDFNCSACMQTVSGGRYIKFADQRYHEQCFACARCGQSLSNQKRKMTDAGPVCVLCDIKKCEKCHQRITEEMILAIDLDKEKHSFHPECLKCALCGAVLLKYRPSLSGFICSTCPTQPSKVLPRSCSSRVPSLPSWQDAERHAFRYPDCNVYYPHLDEEHYPRLDEEHLDGYSNVCLRPQFRHEFLPEFRHEFRPGMQTYRHRPAYTSRALASLDLYPRPGLTSRTLHVPSSAPLSYHSMPHHDPYMRPNSYQQQDHHLPHPNPGPTGPPVRHPSMPVSQVPYHQRPYPEFYSQAFR